MRIARLVGFVAGVASLYGCGSSNGIEPSAEQAASYQETMPPTGEAVPYSLHTHCGVKSARIGGLWWRAIDPPHGGEGPASAPEGWADPYQKGSLTVISDERSVFRAQGAKVVFTPAPDGAPARLCK